MLIHGIPPDFRGMRRPFILLVIKELLPYDGHDDMSWGNVWRCGALVVLVLALFSYLGFLHCLYMYMAAFLALRVLYRHA